MIDDAYACRVEATTAFLKTHLGGRPEVLVILGTGQDVLPEEWIHEGTISYADIPNFPTTTAPGHQGRLVHGKLGKKRCIFLQGRFHWYEGYDDAEITLPIRTIAQLGAKVLLVTNTAGGLNLAFAAGDLMAITDHLNFIGTNPVRGANREEWGPRFPDMSQAYSRRIVAIAENAAKRLGIQLRHGVYIALPGPSLETPAETKFLRNCGGDAVGMSSVPEVIVAIHAGLEVFGLSIIANINDPDRMHPILVADVITQVKKTATNTRKLLQEIINRI